MYLGETGDLEDKRKRYRQQCDKEQQKRRPFNVIQEAWRNFPHDDLKKLYESSGCVEEQRWSY